MADESLVRMLKEGGVDAWNKYLEERRQEDWEWWEAKRAKKLETELQRDVLCPIALDGAWKTCRWPDRLRQHIEEYHVLEFSNPADFDLQFERLVAGLVKHYPGESEDPTEPEPRV